jgi:ATPase subunit of ABC transporter with duplicated ATPase domains
MLLEANKSDHKDCISVPDDVIFGYVTQVILENENLSGGQRLNSSLTNALKCNPNILLLDEPTNHLDSSNRNGLMKMLKSYSGTIIVVTHDKELIRNCIDTLWHIDNQKINVFSGNYDDYISEKKLQRSVIENNITNLNRQKDDMHEKLMREQQRVSKSKSKGEKNVANKKLSKMAGDLKAMKAEKSQGKKLRNIDEEKECLNSRLSELRLPEIILPKFSIDAKDISDHVIVQVFSGQVGYSIDEPILSNISLAIHGTTRIAIVGRNGSGKSTLIKAILGDKHVYKSGDWFVNVNNIGYLDQHYNTLELDKTPIEIISDLVTNWAMVEIRRHLNDFLFRKNEEVNCRVKNLSGGEKARLSMAQIAAKTPKLLILDEITNNLDIETRDYVVQVIKSYPGAIVVISHDTDFLKEIGVVDEVFDVEIFQ